MDHDQADDNSLFRRAFAIEKQEAQVVNGIPVSGEDYLLLVRQQAEQCVQISVAPPPKRILEHSLPFQYQFSEGTPVDANLLPKPSWQKTFVTCFLSFRKAKQDTKPSMTANASDLSKYSNQQWHNLCTSKGILGETSSSLMEYVSPLSQKMIMRLLKLNKDWLETSCEESWQCHITWIFALLTYVDPVLTSKDISVLRDVCRMCIDLRNKYQANSDQVIQLNIIITIISIIFRQTDLQ